MMADKIKKLKLKGKHKTSNIFIGPFQELMEDLVPEKRILYLTDDNLLKHYSTFFSNKEIISVKPGEKSKSLSAIEKIYRKMIDLEFNRNDFIIGFGGGIVTDISGFIASTYMRGLSFGFISTSVLGQVDAVIGGKNGVNLDGYKNMIGTFNQPDFIINDPAFFNTLPDVEYYNGTAEGIKQFLIADAASFDWFEHNIDRYLDKEIEFLYEFIYRQNKIKVDFVARDEFEGGARKKLNFGHSIGHAIERESSLPHGFAISVGMVLAAKISHLLGKIDISTEKKVRNILEKCQLPINTLLKSELLIETMKKDKKRNGEYIDFILLNKIGEAEIKSMSYPDLSQLLIKILT